MSNKGHLFVVAAPSGAGKTSLVHALVKGDDNLVISVSHTTRRKRPGEKDGVHYHFIDRDTFCERALRDEYLEHAEVFGNYYGTHAGTTREQLALGLDVILEIDWQGARQVRDQFPDCHSIFILPPSLVTLRDRLSGRGQDSKEVIDGRMANAQMEISHCEEFQHVVINDDFDAALAELAEIVDACRKGETYYSAEHSKLLEQLLVKG